jgi:site-specific recombinase XerD
MIIEHNQKLMNLYLGLRKNSITKKSSHAFEIDLRVFFEFLDKKLAEEITHKDIDEFLMYCRDDRKNGEEALVRKYNTINAFYRTMIFKEYLDMKNPMDKVDKIKLRKKLRGHVSIKDYNQIMDYLKSINDKRSLAIFSLLFSSGIRLSEAEGLNCDDINFESRQFKVLGKGEKERICLFSKETKNHILEYIGDRVGTSTPVFLSANGGRLSSNRIQRTVKEKSLKAGITKNIHPHLLRHGTAMFLLENGLPLDEIQKVLGHENISTTQIYAQTSLLRVKGNVDKIYENL